MRRVRAPPTKPTDERYTGVEMIEFMLDVWPDGPTTDPCWHPRCHIRANTTYTRWDNGLALRWYDEVWLNFPFSFPAPWVRRAVAHPGPVMQLGRLDPAAAWFQLSLRSYDLLVLPSERTRYVQGGGQRLGSPDFCSGLFVRESSDGLRRAYQAAKRRGWAALPLSDHALRIVLQARDRLRIVTPMPATFPATSTPLPRLSAPTSSVHGESNNGVGFDVGQARLEAEKNVVRAYLRHIAMVDPVCTLAHLVDRLRSAELLEVLEQMTLEDLVDVDHIGTWDDPVDGEHFPHHHHAHSGSRRASAKKENPKKKTAKKKSAKKKTSPQRAAAPRKKAASKRSNKKSGKGQAALPGRSGTSGVTVSTIYGSLHAIAGKSTTQIADQTAIGKRTVIRVLNRLVKNGAARKEGRGPATRYFAGAKG